MRLLRAIGIESIPELHELWNAFLRDHAGEDQNKVIAQSISGGMLEWNFGEPGSKQTVLDAGFDEVTEHPLQLRAIFNLKDGHWWHVATVACRCQTTDDAEPNNYMHPGKLLPQQEWVVTIHLHQGSENHLEYHAKEIRFRLRGSALWPLIEFESRSTICPQGSSYGSNCNVVKTDLEPAKLISEDKKLIPGFVLISWSGKPPQKDMAAMMLYNPHCTPYTWDEAAFAYVPSPLKPVACGIPDKRTSSQPSQTPPGAKPSLHK